MDTAADLQAQIIAVRTAVEGIWLSMLHADPDAVAHAEQLRHGNVQAFAMLDASDAEADAMRNAVAHHTDQLWQNIVRQLAMRPQPQPEPEPQSEPQR